MPRDLAEPWRAFLAALDALVTHDVRLHCCGGFVVTMRYGLARTLELWIEIIQEAQQAHRPRI